jgi:hypothetical protein
MTFGPPYIPEDGGTDEVDFAGPDRPERRRGRLLSLVGVAVIGLVGGGAITYAAVHSGSTPAADSSAAQSTTPSAHPSASPRTGHRGFFRKRAAFGGFAFGALGDAIHGQLTERKPGGGYQTVDIQRGKVTAVSSSSITLKSADGYTATYAVASATEVNAKAAGIATVKVGDRVYLLATVNSGKATAASIVDVTSIGSSRAKFGFAIPKSSPSPPARSQS